MRQLSEILQELIEIACTAIARASLAVVAADARNERFSLIAHEMRAHDGRPAEGVRCTSAGMATVIALEAWNAGGRHADSPWLMVAGALLPVLRAEAWAAFTDERSRRD